MRLGVVGGRLQGTEAAYLGLRAGYEVVLVDRRRDTPASGLATTTHVFDVMGDPSRARAVLGSCDAVLPACEDLATLEWLASAVPSWGIPLVFHLPSYRVTCSKLRSDELFARLDVPRPAPWPECGFPVVVKPSGCSGSEGVCVVEDEAGLAEARRSLEAAGHDVVVQQFVDGPSLSLEVLRYSQGATVPLLPTLLEFDSSFDCKRVLAPVEASPALVAALADAARVLAEGVGLVGLMDVEVMVDGDVPLVIEIDARLPSQTPTAVFHSIGVNLVAESVGVFAGSDTAPPDLDGGGRPRGVCYQHVRAREGRLAVLGEHVMAEAGPLRLAFDELGADEILTDRRPGLREWSATLICRGADASEARARAEAATADLARDAGLELLPETAAPTAGSGLEASRTRGRAGAGGRPRGAARVGGARR